MFFSMKSILFKWLAVTLMTSSLVLTGCNTMNGLGQDIESLGQSIQNVGE